jgi:L-lactate dehydrogenase complex protein LldG
MGVGSARATGGLDGPSRFSAAGAAGLPGMVEWKDGRGLTMNAERTTRQQFLAGVRMALRMALHGSTRRPLPDADEALVRLASANDDVVALFAARAAGVGMTVHRTGVASLAVAIGSVLESRGAKRVAVSMEDLALSASVASVVPEIVDWQDAPALDALYDADAGVTDVLAGIAETGTLVVRSSAGATRGGFFVPPVHLAVVRASKVVPDMVDVIRLLRPLPTSVVMITGPSKTADIEGILITGVHGPKEVHVVLIEDA